MNTSKEFLEAAVVDGQVVQPLRIVTNDGETLVALYTLVRQPDKEWRIGGCELAPSTLQFTGFLHSDDKLQHWRGFPAIFGLDAVLMLEFSHFDKQIPDEHRSFRLALSRIPPIDSGF